MRRLAGVLSGLGFSLAAAAVLAARSWGAGPPPVVPKKPLPAAALPATAPATRPADLIPPATLQQMYRRELGAKYRVEDAERLYAAHRLIEQYFAATRAGERKTIVQQLSATGLDFNLLGRLTRLRMDWPELEEGAYYVNEQVGPHPVRYFFGVPKGYDRAKPWPLVVKLPTAAVFLTDPPPNGDQVAAIYTKWIDEELASHPDACVLMPLLNLDELYGPSYPGMNTVFQPLLHIGGRVNIDPARVYMVGHGMSAHAAWNLALHYPTYFSAFNPLAGAASADWQRLRLVNLRNVLPVVWHDADDTLIKVESSRSLVRVMRTQKLDVEYDETKNIGHVPDAATAERAYGKMRARVRELYPAAVSVQSNRPDTPFNRVDWVQMWQPITPGKDRRVLFRHGSGNMTLNDRSFRIDASRKGNRIEVTTDNVDAFRLYLNDQMVDLNEPITLMLNKRAKMEAKVSLNLEEMLKDQIFLGRGWRYFTAVIDVDVVEHPTTKPASRPSTRALTK